MKRGRWHTTDDKMKNSTYQAHSCHVSRAHLGEARRSRVACHIRRAFTIIELLVVISILAILAALVVPALKNFGHADAVTAATRQMQDDIGRARQLAISQHTTVYMVFVSANFWNNVPPPYGNWFGNLTSAQKTAATNLCDKQMTGYTFVSLRTVGDQPGQGRPHYLAPWQNLPEGTFIATNKFTLTGIPFYIANDTINGFVTNAVPFPTENATTWVLMPCIAFNYLGQLTTNGVDAVISHEYIPLARGNVAPAWDPTTKVYQLGSPPSVTEVPDGNSVSTYNIIDVEPLTGRTTLQQPKVK